MLESKQEQIQSILLIEDQQGEHTEVLQDVKYSVGRSNNNSIVLYSNLISRHHAILLRIKTDIVPGYFYRLIDGNLEGKRSTNGVFVNGKRCFYQDLRHGDVIMFGGEVKTTYYMNSQKFNSELTSLASKDNSFPETSYHDPSPTMIAPATELDTSSDAAIARLAFFSELLANPIIELTPTGTITYLNSATLQQFPTILELRTKHPILAELTLSIELGKEKSFIRELKYENQVFQQHIHYDAKTELLRSYLVNITERKQIEVALKQTTKRLESITQHTAELNHLNQQLKIELNKYHEENKALKNQADEQTSDLSKIKQFLTLEITKRQQAEESLQQNQGRLGSLIDLLPGIVFSRLNEPGWGMNYLSEGCLTVTGYQSEQLTRHQQISYNSIIHPQDLPKVLNQIEQAIFQRQSYTVDYRIYTKSGAEKWLREKGTGVFRNGVVITFEGFITDITQPSDLPVEESEKFQKLVGRNHEAHQQKMLLLFKQNVKNFLKAAAITPALREKFNIAANNPAEFVKIASNLGYNFTVEQFLEVLKENILESNGINQNHNYLWLQSFKWIEKALRNQPSIPEKLNTQIPLDQAVVELYHSNKKLGGLLVEQQLISPHKLDEMLGKQNTLLGQLLIEEKIIFKPELEQLLAEQRNSNKKLGEILIEKKIISPEQLETILKKQKRQTEILHSYHVS